MHSGENRDHFEEGMPMCESESKKERRAWMPIALLAGLGIYLASFGPACWLLAVNHRLTTTCNIVYSPVIWVSMHGPEPVRNSILKFANLGIREGYVMLWGNRLQYLKIPAFT